MPTFDYRCSGCGNSFEFQKAFGSKEHPACPACASRKTEKLLSPPSVHFKGSGFYKTDSGAKKHAPAKEAPKADKTEAPAKASEGTAVPKEKPKMNDQKSQTTNNNQSSNTQ